MEEEMEAPLFAEVLLDHPSRQLDRPFTYLVPASLRDKIEVGCLVVVPFLKGKLMGYVLGLSTETSLAKLKEIERVVEEPPLFGRDSVELCRWMSEHYLAPLSQVFRLMIPPGRGRSLQEEVRSLIPLEEALAGLHPRAELLRSVLQKLDEAGGSMPLGSLRARFQRRNISAALNALAEKGLIERVARLSSPQAEQASVAVVRIEESGSDLLRGPGWRRENGEGAGLSRLQEAALAKLSEEGGEMPRSRLIKATGIGYASLSSLEKRGLVSITNEPKNRDPFSGFKMSSPETVRLNREQEKALSEINGALDRREHRVFLLHGITGSGKTEVYLRAIRRTMEAGRSSIVLVPEIALTPQMVERFKGALGETVAVLHSGLSAGERYDQWTAIKRGACRVVIGARSALFAPAQDLGLIVIDEEHETTYKENVAPRYHAREVAEFRARLNDAVLVLGSATPRLETEFMARRGDLVHLRLTRRVDDRPLPRIEVVDMRESNLPGVRTILSNHLVNALLGVMESGEQAILFRCHNCSVSLCYHLEQDRLVCHHCSAALLPPFTCPDCGKQDHVFRGVGTERVEMELRRLLPDLNCLRMDADTTRRKHSHWKILEDFKAKRAHVLLGTQMIAKGLDIPSVTLVGVINADTSLALPDFRAAERTFQLLTQVSGRAGRGEKPGRVIIQTFSPENYAIQACVQGNDEAFYRQELAWRREAGYPPYRQLISLVLSSPVEGACVEASDLLRGILEESLPPDRVELLGPASAPLSRLKGKYRYHLLIKSEDLDPLKPLLRKALSSFEHRKAGVLKGHGLGKEGLGLAVDVDPASLL
jgi:primosomal protein N' (replication factor Y)